MRKNNFLKKAVHPLFVIGLTLPLLATHCEEFEDIPSIKICDSNFKDVTGDTIEIKLNSSANINIDVYYENGERTYTRKIDDGESEDLKNSNDFHLKSNNSYGNSSLRETSKVTTNFADSVMNVGSLVTIKIQLGTYLSESVYFKVIQ